MCPSPAFIAINAAPGPELLRVKDGIRAIVEMIDKRSGEGSGRSGDTTLAPEEILVDTEVDGSRYLLVRMPGSQSHRVQLSPREQEIVRMVAKGHPNKVIADVLNISSWTVCTHLRRIFAKLGVGSRAAMVAQLLEARILSQDHCSPSHTREFNQRRIS